MRHVKLDKVGNRMDLLTGSTHLHIAVWVLGVVLFLVAAFGVKAKALHMVLRLMYILIIITGAALFFKYSSGDQMGYGIKFLLGILTIAMMEMVLVKQSKGKKTTIFWILFVVFLLATMFYGFKLPLGLNFFA